MNLWRNIQARIIERRYRRDRRRIEAAYRIVNADLARRIQAAQEAWVRNEASRGIADIEQEINRRQR